MYQYPKNYWNDYWDSKKFSYKVVHFLRKYYFSKVLANYLELHFNGKKILEAGCGSCDILKRLSDKKFETFGIDSNKIAINKARKRGLKNLSVQDVQKTNFTSNFFDVVYSVSVAEYIENEEKFFKECLRVVNKNGITITIIPNSKSFLLKYFNILTHKKPLRFLWDWRKEGPMSSKKYDELSLKFRKRMEKMFEKFKNYKIEKVPNTFGIFLAIIMKKGTKSGKNLINKTLN